MARVQPTLAAGLYHRPGHRVAVLYCAIYRRAVRQHSLRQLPAGRRRCRLARPEIPALPRATVLIATARVVSQLRSRLESLALDAIVGAMAIAWAGVFGYLSVVRHLALGSHAEDLGFTDQVLWN